MPSLDQFGRPVCEGFRCPSCDARTRLEWDVKTDKYTCSHCGHEGTVSEFKDRAEVKEQADA